MKHITTIETRDLAKSVANGGCGECQTSCQSACKTSCGVANQPCENKEKIKSGESLSACTWRGVQAVFFWRRPLIHQYKLNGYNIVLDTYSGSIHVVDDIAYDIIGMYESADEQEICRKMLEKYGDLPEVTEEEIKSCIDDVKDLKEAGKLFAPDIYEGISGGFKNNSRDIKALLPACGA